MLPHPATQPVPRTSAWTITPQVRPPSWQPAFYLALGYIFVTYTRLPEVVGPRLRLGLISTILAILIVLLSGGLFRVFSSRIVLALLAFTVWMCVCTPLSIWRGGSISHLISWSLAMITVILLAGCIDGFEQCRKALYVMAVSVLAIEVQTLLLGSADTGADIGRFAFGWGTLANPNDLATLLLMGLPFCLFVVRTRRGLSILKVACFLGLIFIPLTVVRTGSRGGLLALVLMFALYFFSVPFSQKVPLAIAALLLAVASVTLFTRNALNRYKTIFVSTDQTYYTNTVESSAVESSRSRKELFLRSVRMTVEHPVFGVGPGQFQVADANNSKERNQPAEWHQTHNTFTQISAEEGLPALFFYVAALVFCFQTLRAARKYAVGHPELVPLRDMAVCLRFSMLAFVSTAVFASNAYYFYLPLVAGLCAALERAMHAELEASKAREATVQPPVPAAPPFPRTPLPIPARSR